MGFYRPILLLYHQLAGKRPALRYYLQPVHATGQAAGHTDGPVEVLVRPENVRVHVADGAADASGAAVIR